MTELVVPLRARGEVAGAWRQMVECGSYDCLVNVDAAEEAAERARRALQLPLVRLRDIDRHGPSSWSTHPAFVVEGTARTSLPVMATSREAPLWEVAASGDLAPAHEADLDGLEFSRRPRTDDEIGRAQLVGDTLLDRGVEQFRENRASDGPWPAPAVVWVTKPNSLADCIWYWNCRALRPLEFETTPMLLLPHQGVEGWIDFPRQLQSVLHRAEDIEPDVAICSLSATPDQLKSIARLFGLRASRKKLRRTHRFPPPPVRTPPFTYRRDLDPRAFVVFDRQYGVTTDVVIHTDVPRTLLRGESPVRFSGGGRILVRVSSAAFDHLPRVDALAGDILGGADWAPTGALQIRTHAGPRFHFELTIPEIDDATWKVLHSVTAQARLSDKGRLAHRICERSARTVLLQPGVLQLVSELTTPRSKELRRELSRLRSGGRGDAELVELASQWGGRTQRRHRSIGDLRAIVGDEAYDAAELLATEDWVERGFEIQCDQCTIRSFVPLNAVGPAAVCPACEASQVFKRSRGPDLFYRLNGLVDRASDQGVLPHILAADVLARRNPSTYLLLGVDVEFPDGHRAEVDLFGLHGGRVIAGEAKTSPTEFSVEQLQRDVDISHRLGAEAHVVASPNGIDGELVERAARFVRAKAMELLIVEGADVREVDLHAASGAGLRS